MSTVTKNPLIKNEPFIARSGLTDRWYFVRSWRSDDHGNKVAHEKFDITDEIRHIINEANTTADV
jgi:hypothetical protein